MKAAQKQQKEMQQSINQELSIQGYQNEFDKISQLSSHIKNNPNLNIQDKDLKNNSQFKIQNDDQKAVPNQNLIQLSNQQMQSLLSISVSQLLQEKSKLIQQLQTINNNLSEIIDQKEKSSKEIESLKKQTSQNRSIHKQMTQQCRDYEFMLSGDYGLKLTEQIQHEKAYLRQLRKQVWQITKQMQKPIETLIKQNQEKDKELYQLQLFVIQQKTLLQQKKLKLQQIQRQSDIKKDKTNKLHYRQKELKKLIQIYFDQDYETIKTKNPKNTQQNFFKLKIKRQKINKVLLSLQSNCLKNYNKKLAQIRQMERFLAQVEQAINECSLKIMETKQEKQSQKIKHSRIIQKNKQKQTRQTLSTDHYQYSKHNMQRKLFSLPKFVQKRVVPRYPQNNPYRNRMYTELQNNDYFKHQKKQKQQSNQGQITNERLKTDSGYGNQFRNTYESRNSNQNELQAQKLQILKTLLNRELVQKHKKIKDKKLSFIAQRSYPIMNSMQTNTQQSQSWDHYRQLCLQLGKQKLLIEQDQDIRELIYQGIGGQI